MASRWYGNLAAAALLAAGPAAAQDRAERPDAVVLARYGMSAGLSVISKAEIVIRVDGDTRVTLTRRATESHVFRLNAGELEALKALAGTTGFFNQPAVIPDPGPGHGHQSLTLALEGRSRLVKWGYSRQLFPLSRFFGEIVNQGMLLTDLAGKGSKALPASRDALTPGTTSRKVLQPRVLREPIEAALRAAGAAPDAYELASGLVALAHVTTPAEYLGFLAGEIERSPEPRRSRLLSLAGGAAPGSHAVAVAPLMLHHLRAGYARWPELAEGQRTALEDVIRCLGETRFYEAIPTLVDLIRERPDEAGWAPIALVWLDARTPVEGLLETKQPQVRARAARILGSMGARHARPPQDAAESPDRHREMLRQLRTLTAPRLQGLAQSDPSEEVREAARQALRLILPPDRAVP